MRVTVTTEHPFCILSLDLFIYGNYELKSPYTTGNFIIILCKDKCFVERQVLCGAIGTQRVYCVCPITEVLQVSALIIHLIKVVEQPFLYWSSPNYVCFGYPFL